MGNWPASKIVEVLSTSLNEESIRQVSRIRKVAPIRELLKALGIAQQSNVRQILCDILGNRHAKSAGEVLSYYLDDVSPNVRAAAADALAKVGDVRWGNALLERLAKAEHDQRVRQMLVLALGAIKYLPAIPTIISILDEADSVLRGCAAWSLGSLHATDGIPKLREVVAVETGEYSKKRMEEALKALLARNNVGH